MSPPTRGEAPAATPGASSKKRSRRPKAQRTNEVRLTIVVGSTADADTIVDLVTEAGIRHGYSVEARPACGPSHGWRAVR